MVFSSEEFIIFNLFKKALEYVERRENSNLNNNLSPSVVRNEKDKFIGFSNLKIFNNFGCLT